MDLAYLEWLQNIRMSLPPIFEQFFLLISDALGQILIIPIICLTYWCFDKMLGKTLLFSIGISSYANNFIKLLACTYRPWVRSDAIHPTQGALKGATGYSFPSGHTQMASNTFGTIAHYMKKAAITIVCAILIVLTALSRNILGVHTPQDVIVGLLIGISTIFIAEPIMRWGEEKEGNDLKLLVATIALCIVTTIIVLVKPYPTDYDASGSLLVDPVTMQADYFKTVGLLVGVMLGWFLERRYVNFTTPENRDIKVMALRVVVCVAIIGVFFAFTHVFLKNIGFNNSARCFLEFFLLVFGGVYLGPLSYTKIEKLLGW
jgi:membrane-associated phospholipid phosphatase